MRTLILAACLLLCAAGAGAGELTTEATERAMLMRREATVISRETRYVVAHDGERVFHAIRVEPGQVAHSGLPHLEVFATEKEALEKFPRISFGDDDDASEVSR